MLKAFFEPFLAEQNRWFLWAPVFLGVGITIYFSLGAEPGLWPALSALAFFTVLSFFLRHTNLLPAALACFFVSLGFVCAQLETWRAFQPMLQEKKEKQVILGRVSVINHLPDGFRLYLDDVRAEGLADIETPRSVRIKFKYQEKVPEAGAWIAVPAMLYPLSGPVEPGAFNFRRYAYFHGFGATGFAVGGWKEAVGPPVTGVKTFLLFFERLRSTINAALLSDNKTPEAAIAAALISGDQSGIDAGTLSSMRISGISHILSVSGLHIALVAGIVFFAIRAIFLFIPYLGLAWPIKKIAAVFALCAALFYTLMCAAPVPAVRAMVMSGILLVAILFDRRALSMRLVALAAFLTLLVVPSALLDPSFQLSFGAIMALVAVYEKNEHALWQRFKSEGILGKIFYYFIASILTSIVASAATAPLILYTFQQVTWYGVLTNLLALPLSTFIIMPAGIAAVLAMPFGLEALPLSVMKQGINWMIEAAHFVASLPGAVTYHPALPPYALPLICLGGVWLCIWQKGWRFLGFIPLLLGAFSFLITPRPDILLAEDGVTLALKAADGTRIVRARDKEDFTVKAWLQRDGKGPDGWKTAQNFFDVMGAGGQGPLTCINDACLYTYEGQRVALPMAEEAVQGMCGKTELILSPFLAHCDSSLVLSGVVGAHAIFLKQSGVVLHAVHSQKRPWN